MSNATARPPGGPESRMDGLRIRTLGGGEVNSDGGHVLYWMIANRRTRWNFSLQRAVDWSFELQKPLIIFEALRCGYRWASDRLHAFVISGMRDNREACANRAVRYLPYVEPEEGAGKGLPKALADEAAVVVTDDFPCFMLPRMVASAAKQVECRFEAVDGNGILPMRQPNRTFTRAFSFRIHLHKTLPDFFEEAPMPDPLSRLDGSKLEAAELPFDIDAKWPSATSALLDGVSDGVDSEGFLGLLAELPIDHEVAPVAERPGGANEAKRRLDAFMDSKIDQYGDDRNKPAEDGASGFSPWLHFGHLSAQEVLHRVLEREDWTPDQVGEAKPGKREWWGLSDSAEAFLDELITWRELGYNMCVREDNYDQFESLPDFARITLKEHADDERDPVYSLEEFEQAKTHDELWNAAQNQLRKTGIIHNYLRMLWGKKILHWSRSPREALDIMIELNNKYALDGRNPNSYSGIFWVLGRYDRAWGPEREIFGKVRYMTSASTRRKYKVDPYIAKWNG